MFPGFGYGQKRPRGGGTGAERGAIIRAVSTQRFQIVAHRLNAAAVAPFQRSGERWVPRYVPQPRNAHYLERLTSRESIRNFLRASCFVGKLSEKVYEPGASREDSGIPQGAALSRLP